MDNKERKLWVFIYLLIIINLVQLCINVYYIGEIKTTQCIEIETGK